MLLKKINKMNSILRAKENIQDADFKQILLDSDLIITQSDIKIVDAATVDIEYLIMDITTEETLKTRSIGKGQNPESAQKNAYKYMQKMIFSYEKSKSVKKEVDKKIENKKEEIAVSKEDKSDNVVNIKDSIINRNQQRKLFAMASYDKIHEVIDSMGYSSIKDIRVSDFSKIVEILELESIEKNTDLINSLPNIMLPFGKYKGKSLRDIIEDKHYIEYLYNNTKNPNIKNAARTALQVYKA